MTSFIHPFVHHLDLFAAALTCLSTTLLACRRRAGFLTLICGSLAWLAVALLSSFQARPIWGMVLSSGWTILWSLIGWARWNSHNQFLRPSPSSRSRSRR